MVTVTGDFGKHRAQRAWLNGLDPPDQGERSHEGSLASPQVKRCARVTARGSPLKRSDLRGERQVRGLLGNSVEAELPQGPGGVENLGGWLTTIVARLCLNMLRSRSVRHEQTYGVHLPDPVISLVGGPRPDEEALLADSVGLALLVVLDALAPAERLAFVLHDMFDLPFEEIARAAPTSPSSPGRRSSGMSRSTAQHLRMTPPWPDTGPNGGARRRPRPRTSTPPGSCEPRTGAAPHAGNFCSTPTTSHAAHASKNSGS